jgi:Bacterial regulatory proteins, tetR family
MASRTLAQRTLASRTGSQPQTRTQTRTQTQTPSRSPQQASPLKQARKGAAALPLTRDPERTRARILEAAKAEFAAYGLGGARVDRIAAVALANKRMLYYYFGNKDDLFVAVLEDTYSGIRAAEVSPRSIRPRPSAA